MDWFGVVVFALGVHAGGMIVHLWITHGKQDQAHEALCRRVSDLDRQEGHTRRRLSDMERQAVGDAACLKNLVCTTQGLLQDVWRLQDNRPCPDDARQSAMAEAPPVDDPASRRYADYRDALRANQARALGADAERSD